MMRALKWTGGFLLLAILLAVAYVALFGWNWLREPVSRLATEKTGRELVIGGDLQLSLGWPLLHVRAADVKFDNPLWASRKHMLAAADVDFALDLPTALFERRLALEKSRLSYEEAAQKTSITAEISTRDDKAEGDVVLNAQGRYRGQPFMARGSGGPVLAMRDERRPIPSKSTPKSAGPAPGPRAR